MWVWETRGQTTEKLFIMNNILIFTFIGELYFYVSTPDEIKKWSIRKRKPSLLSLTVNISVISLSNLTTKDSFRISFSWGFQSCPWLLYLIKKLWEIYPIKEKGSICELTTFLCLKTYDSRFGHRFDNFPFVIVTLFYSSKSGRVKIET